MQPFSADESGAPTSAYAAFEAIVAALARPEHADRVRTRRTEREARTGATDSEDEGFEAKMLAFWDAAGTTPALLEALRVGSPRAGSAGIAEQPFGGWLDAFSRAHRGLFRVQRAGSGEGAEWILDDVWGGASFFLIPAPPRELALSLQSTEGLFDGRLVGRADPLSVSLLPGAVFHPPDATPAIEGVLTAARTRGLDREDTLDALLRMESRLRAHSRVKPSYAYRPESL